MRKRVLLSMLDTMHDTSVEQVLAVFSLREHVSVAKAKEYLREIEATRILPVKTSRDGQQTFAGLLNGQTL